MSSLSALLAILAAPGASPPPATFVLSGQTSDGKALTLPLDAAGKTLVLVAGLTQRSAGATACLSEGLEHRIGSRAEIVGVAVLDAVPGFARGFVRRAIDKQIGPPAPGKALFMTTFDGSAVRANAPAGDADAPVIFVLRPDGSLASATRAACSDGVLTAVERSVP